MEVKFRKGDRVKHSSRTDWGLGEVLADPAGDQVEVFFEDIGVKKFKLAFAKFIKVSGEESESDYLTSLVRHFYKEKGRGQASVKQSNTFTPFPRAVGDFLRYFPGGFQDQKFLCGPSSEREYKVAAHDLLLELLGRESLREMLEGKLYWEICNRAKCVVNRTNLIHHYEKIWLSNGLSDETNQRAFAEMLNDLLYGDEGMQARFERFCDMLYEIGAAKWPIATYFPFVAFPESHIFIKPEVTKHAADVLGLSIDYRPELNWGTYNRVLELAETLKGRLCKDGRAELVPRDMIDVQSFIWVTAPGYFA